MPHLQAGLTHNSAKALRIISGSNSRTQRSSATAASSMRKSKGQTKGQRCIRTWSGSIHRPRNPRSITELFRDSKNSQIFMFHSRQLSEGRILSHLFNGKLTLKWVTTGYTICPTNLWLAWSRQSESVFSLSNIWTRHHHALPHEPTYQFHWDLTLPESWLPTSLEILSAVMPPQ